MFRPVALIPENTSLTLERSISSRFGCYTIKPSDVMKARSRGVDILDIVDLRIDDKTPIEDQLSAYTVKVFEGRINPRTQSRAHELEALKTNALIQLARSL